MVREEYLNLDFMYKFINTLCRRDGYILSEFDFGMLTHNKIDDIAWTLQNGHGYNMVYKFKAYKIPNVKLKETKHYMGYDEYTFEEKQQMSNRIKSGEFISDDLSIEAFTEYMEILDILSAEHTPYKAHYENCIDYKELSEQLLNKIKIREFCFDLSSETIIDYDAKKTTFVKNPPFFRLNNQTYYAIYNQPKILKYHFSHAREYKKALQKSSGNNHIKTKNTLIKYMETMDLYTNNLIDVREMCSDLSASNGSKPLKAEKYENLIYKDSYSRNEDIINIKKIKALSIHDDDAPIFYTDNALELNAPLVESITKCYKENQQNINMLKKQIGMEIDYKFRDIDASLKLIVNSIHTLSCWQLRDIQSTLWPRVQAELSKLAFWQAEQLYPSNETTPGLSSGAPDVKGILNMYNTYCDIENRYSTIIGDMTRWAYIRARPQPHHPQPHPSIDITPEQAIDAENKAQQIYAQIKSALEKLTPETMSVDSLVKISRLLNKTELPQKPTKTR